MRKAFGYVLAIIIILVSWHLIALAVGSPALPTPLASLSVLSQELPALIPEFIASLWRVIASLVIGTALAVPIGLALGRSKHADAVLAPLLYLLYPIPKIVFLPVLLVLLGLGDTPKIALIAITVFFQVLVSARDAAKAVPQSLITSARSLGASRWGVYRHVIVPASLPEVFTALRIGSGTAIAILFIAESIAGTSGLGWFIVDAWGLIDYPRMFAGIIAMALLGVLIYEIVALLERALTRWRQR